MDLKYFLHFQKVWVKLANSYLTIQLSSMIIQRNKISWEKIFARLRENMLIIFPWYWQGWKWCYIRIIRSLIVHFCMFQNNHQHLMFVKQFSQLWRQVHGSAFKADYPIFDVVDEIKSFLIHKSNFYMKHKFSQIFLPLLTTEQFFCVTKNKANLTAITWNRKVLGDPSKSLDKIFSSS